VLDIKKPRCRERYENESGMSVITSFLVSARARLETLFFKVSVSFRLEGLKSRLVSAP